MFEDRSGPLGDLGVAAAAQSQPFAEPVGEPAAWVASLAGHPLPPTNVWPGPVRTLSSTWKQGADLRTVLQAEEIEQDAASAQPHARRMSFVDLLTDLVQLATAVTALTTAIQDARRRRDRGRPDASPEDG
ncbi:hypothetical protein ACIHFD_36560 [Nonomuraea sp. NPDC051941]|uniref:hypothetical protein n=1 Tax=Nonomuraea sp. NPDC051941 TaxID=3364373 RepID=UPI0037C7B115